MSSSCTGVYTAEVALALITNICNSAGCFDFEVDISPYSCHDFRLNSYDCFTLIKPLSFIYINPLTNIMSRNKSRFALGNTVQFSSAYLRNWMNIAGKPAFTTTSGCSSGLSSERPCHTCSETFWNKFLLTKSLRDSTSKLGKCKLQSFHCCKNSFASVTAHTATQPCL